MYCEKCTSDATTDYNLTGYVATLCNKCINAFRKFLRKVPEFTKYQETKDLIEANKIAATCGETNSDYHVEFHVRHMNILRALEVTLFDLAEKWVDNYEM